MVNLSGIGVSFGGTVLFEDITFLVNPTDRIGLTGRNGAGKSTLLRIVAGEQTATTGVVAIPRDYRIGYLPQEFHHKSTLSVKEEAQQAFKEILHLQADIEKLTTEVTTRTDYESAEYHDLLVKLDEKQHRFQILGGYEMEENTEKILRGLGFTQEELARPMNEFSGGWQMRVELAKLLLQKPDLVMLDEPTNHLDIESIIWLESFLKDYPGAIMMISHDKVFLDKLTNRTIEITGGGMEEYKANYSGYLQMRAERRQQVENAHKNQQKQIAQMERNIERFRYKASKASFAQNLIKKLDKIDRIELEDEDIVSMKIRFPEPPRAGKVVIKADHVTKSFGSKDVIRPFSFEVERGDKIAFVGKNGMGKTTMARMIVGDLAYDSGILETGHNVLTGYFAQHRTGLLSPDNTILQEMENAAHGSERFTMVRSILGAFLFSGESVDKKVKVLSGGEKSRLSLAKLMLEPINLLILDEPTNHLDMISKEVLKSALQQFEGTVIVVSHDRDFLSGLTNKVFEFTPGGIKLHPGDVNDFLKTRNAENFREFEKEEKVRNTAANASSQKDEYEKRKVAEKEIKKLRNAVQKSEKRVEELTAAVAAMDALLADPATYKERMNDKAFFDDYENKKAELDKAYQQWENDMNALGILENGG